MSDLKPVVYLFRKEHAAKLRIARHAIMAGRPGLLDYRWPTEVIEVLMLMDDLAEKIDQAVAIADMPVKQIEKPKLPANVVEFRRK